MTTANQHSPGRGRIRRRDDGISFIEVLVSVVLLGTVGIAVLVGMSTALRGTSAHDRLATVQANLSDAGDHITDVTFSGGADVNYRPCAVPGDYAPQVDPWSVTITSIRYWTGSGWSGAVSDCVGNEMQEITLESSIEGTTRQLVVVKRKATVAVTAGGAWNDEMVTPEPHSSLP